MRARSWIALGGLALACGGTSFTSTGDNAGGVGNLGGKNTGGSASSQGGSLGHAGSGVGGSLLGNGGKLGTAGAVGIAGKAGATSVGGGGDVAAGGVGMGGEIANAGAGPGPDPIDKTCPLDLPESGRGCADGLTCSYGDDIRPACHSRAKCDNGVWTLELPKCVAINACDAIVQGSHCDAKPSCTIQDSIFCACTGCTGVGPCSTETVWQCTGSPAGCPALIPNEGQVCVGNLACTYGSCTTGEKVTASCNGAAWGWKSLICPR
jgi:large repetitive protein